jgi:hypothetical protein
MTHDNSCFNLVMNLDLGISPRISNWHPVDVSN